MNLEEYISKYIDGELSTEEDVEMRSLVSEDLTAREEFEHAALISVAMMRDAEDIEVPAALFEETNGTILQKIHLSYSVSLKAKKTGQKRVYAVALLLLMFFISDPFHNSYPTQKDVGFVAIESRARAMQAQVTLDKAYNATGTKIKVRTSKSEGPNFRSIEHVVQNNARDASISDGREGSGIAEVTKPRGILESQQQIMTSLSTNSLEESKSMAVLRRALSNSPSQVLQYNDLNGVNSANSFVVPSTVAASADSKSNIEPFQDVQLSTFVGSILSSTAATGSRQHVSQSLGYKVSESDNIGIEVGSFSMMSTTQYQEGAGINATPNDGARIHTGTLNGSEDGAGTNASGTNSGHLATVSTTAARDQVWAGAFFEHSVIRNPDLNVKGRVAVGSSDAGPIVLARAFSTYRVYGPMSLTLGTEGRMFFLDNKNLSSGGQSLQTMVSIVYGLQIKF